MVLIPPGEFTMGAPDSDTHASPHEKPQHRVRLTKAFAISATEITHRQFRQFVEATKYVTQAESDGQGAFAVKATDRIPELVWPKVAQLRTDEHPVTCVSWEDARQFCEWLSRTEGKTYRLPTDAEWEYACRAGTNTRYSFGDDSLDPNADHYRAAPGTPVVSQVAQFLPNPFGLFDMHGNLHEMCWDSARTFTYDEVVDPVGPLDVSLPAVIRSGAISSSHARLRSSQRFITDTRVFPVPPFATTVKGFRVLMEVGQSPSAISSLKTTENTVTSGSAFNEKALTNPIVSPDYTWSEPVNLGPGVNSAVTDESACISSDGLTLIFNWLEKGKLRLWESRRTNISEAFGSATLLSAELNAPRSDNDTPFLSRDGLALWFSSNRPMGHGLRDLWKSRRQSLTAAWEPPTNLGQNVNTTSFEQSPFVTNDGRTLFFSRNVSDHFQILQATRTKETEPFGDARILAHVNDGECSSFPRVTADGLVLLFVHATNRGSPLGLWFATRRSVDEEFGVPTSLGPTINDSFASGPSLSADGLTLYYASQRPGGLGGDYDLWSATRVLKPREKP